MLNDIRKNYFNIFSKMGIVILLVSLMINRYELFILYSLVEVILRYLIVKPVLEGKEAMALYSVLVAGIAMNGIIRNL